MTAKKPCLQWFHSINEHFGRRPENRGFAMAKRGCVRTLDGLQCYPLPQAMFSFRQLASKVSVSYLRAFEHRDYALMKSCFSSVRLLCVFTIVLACGSRGFGQTCFTSDDMDAATRTAIQTASTRFFDMVVRGDAASLKQNSIPAVANNFAGIEGTITAKQAEFAGVHATPQSPFQLKAEGTAPLERADFLCGVFNGPQAAKSAEFVIPNLPPGTYGIVMFDFQTPKSPYTLSFVLQQQGTDWKLGGFFLHPNQILGHDADWFLQKARDFKAKGQTHNAWLYFLQARDLAMPLSFMYTLATDKIYDEEQAVRPNDFPIDGSTVDLAGPNGKTYKMTAVFALQVDQNLDVVLKYLTSDVSNTGQTFQENMDVMRAMLTKFPELRDAFDGVVTRAVELSGRDYGSMLAIKDIK
jgi:hypothetical protein